MKALRVIVASVLFAIVLVACGAVRGGPDFAVLEARLEAIGERLNRGELDVEHAREEIRVALSETATKSGALDPVWDVATIAAVVLGGYATVKSRKNGLAPILPPPSS